MKLFTRMASLCCIETCLAIATALITCIIRLWEILSQYTTIASASLIGCRNIE
jgi:hypothetical protein